jgi:uncharacterized protein YbjT (DUF2867 family)
MKKVILVIGATGAQGGSVANFLLKSNRYVVRGLVRNRDSEKSKALAAKGVELFEGNLDDRATLERAMSGADGVFGVTNFWEHFDKEYQQGLNIIDAAVNSGIGHLVLSTLPSTLKITGGKIDVPHFETKAKLEDYARTKLPGATFLHVAFYYENFIHFFPPHKAEDGNYYISFPQGDTPLAATSAEDVGGVVVKIFDDPKSFEGKVVGVVGSDSRMSEYTEVLPKLTGKRIIFRHMSREDFAGLGFPGAEDLANMFDFYRLYVPERRADLDNSRRLYPDMQSFEKWAGNNKTALVDLVK